MFSILKYLPNSVLLRLVKVLNDVENIYYSLDFNDLVVEIVEIN